MTEIENPLSDWAPSGVHLLDEADLRARIAAFYKLGEGLRSSGPTEAAYEAALFPADDPAWRHVYADSAFSCAIYLRAALYHLGVDHPLIVCPYRRRVGMAVADVATVARHYKALVEGKTGLATYEPRAGDGMCSMGGAGPHVSCVVGAAWLSGPGNSASLVLDCVDGGQGHKGSMAIEANRYLHTGLALRSVEGPTHSLEKPGPGRPLVWVADLWTILLNAGVLADRS